METDPVQPPREDAPCAECGQPLGQENEFGGWRNPNGTTSWIHKWCIESWREKQKAAAVQPPADREPPLTPIAEIRAELEAEMKYLNEEAAGQVGKRARDVMLGVAARLAARCADLHAAEATPPADREPPEVLSCPFCGCEGFVELIDGAWIAGCNAGQFSNTDDVACRASAIGFYHRTREGAVANWNRRPAPADEQEFEKAVDEVESASASRESATTRLPRIAAARTEVMRLWREKP